MTYPRLTAGKKFYLLVVDFFLFEILFYFAFTLRVGSFDPAYFVAPGVLATVLTLLIFSYILGCYDVDELRGRNLFKRLIAVILITAILVVFANYLFARQRSGVFGRGILFGLLFSYLIIATGIRVLYRRWFKARANRSRWILLSDPRVDQVIQQDNLQASLRGQYEVIDVTTRDSRVLPDADGYIVAASSQSMSESWKNHLLQKKMAGFTILTWAHFIEINLRKIPVEHIEVDWFFFHSGYGLTKLSLLRIKRLHDLFFSILLLAFTWPFMVLTAIAIRLESAGPIIFSQKRTGLNGHDFTIYKFRSMRTDAEASGPQWAKEKDHRITMVGAILRKTRLDELPQLFNVFRGDMSFIGPRPERPEFNLDLEQKIPFYNLRHVVRPGLTGWAQILYPYGASVTDSKNKLEYDLFYIKNYSFILDYLIILRTIKIVLFGKGR